MWNCQYLHFKNDLFYISSMKITRTHYTQLTAVYPKYYWPSRCVNVRLCAFQAYTGEEKPNISIKTQAFFKIEQVSVIKSFIDFVMTSDMMWFGHIRIESNRMVWNVPTFPCKRSIGLHAEMKLQRTKNHFC